MRVAMGIVQSVGSSILNYGRIGHKFPGSIWREKSFELECRPGGYRGLIACVTEDNQRIPVNGTRDVNGRTNTILIDLYAWRFHHGLSTIRQWHRDLSRHQNWSVLEMVKNERGIS